mmetsp:Transcript_32305/g.107804  ORF Transcript_32305/g.107804 Transcript_32305/m.107804 type:complete len:305 (-) Transcript_32305:222-1136(-)
MQREIFFFPLRSAPRAWRRSKTRRPRSGGAACRGRPSAGGSRGGAAPPTAARGRGSPRRLRRRAAWRPRRRGGPPRNRSPRCRALRRANPCPPRPRRQRRRRACCARRKPCSRALLCTALHVYGQHVQDMSRACGGWCLSPALRRAPLSLRGDGSLAAVYGDDSLVAALGVELRLPSPFNTQCHDCQAAALCIELRREGRSELEQGAILAASRLYLAARGEVPHPSSSSEPRPGNAAASSGRTSSYSASQSAGASCPGAAYASSHDATEAKSSGLGKAEQAARRLPPLPPPAAPGRAVPCRGRA